jgi:predicted dehydrogenase
MDPIRVGIVGLGTVGRLRANLIARHPAMALVAVADPAGGAPDLPATCAVFNGADSLLRHNLDAVFVCTPNAVTAQIAVAALEAGRHVFCEKPPGRNLDEAQQICAAAARRPRQKLKFGFNHRYHDAVLEAMNLVRGGALGRLLWLRGVYGKSGGRGFEENWRSKREIAGGGILLDQGIHMLDLFRAFCGEFTEVKSFVGNSFWKIDVEDNAFALLRNATGQVAMLHSSSTQWKHVFSLEIFLSEGYIAVSGILSGTRTYGRETLVVARRQIEAQDHQPGNPREEVTYFDEDRSWAREVAEFADCICYDRPVAVGTPTDALNVMELVYRIYRDDRMWSQRLLEREGYAG